MKAKAEYAKTEDGVNIAYQVLGEGPLDLVWAPGFVSHLEAYSGEPRVQRFFERIASFCRLIRFDKRGTGLSDRLGDQHLEQWIDDMRAVMDEVESNQAAVFGISGGGPVAMLFAATYPKRTSALVIYASGARYLTSDDYPWGTALEEGYADLAGIESEWGRVPIEDWAPTVKDDASVEEQFFQWQRLSASPGAVMSILSTLARSDIRHVLPAINVPTLVIHNVHERIIDVGHGRYLAKHIPGAKYVELPGQDHLPYFEHPDLIIDEMQEFLTGTRPVPEVDRVFATVLFTDIVGSTQQAAKSGDRRWRDLMESHDLAMKQEIDTFRGRQVKQTGDGVLATFDGPSRAIHCAKSMVQAARQLGVEIRAGLHAGECEVLGEDIHGITVNIAARVAGLAGPGQVLVSQTVRDIVAGSGISVRDQGFRALNGVPGEWRLFSVDLA